MHSQPARMDVAEMRRRLGDDEELIADVVRLFLEDYPDRRSALTAAAKAGDLAALRREAHSLKGSASHLAARALMDAAGALEDAALAGRRQDIDALFSTLVAETEGVVTMLHDMQNGRS